MLKKAINFHGHFSMMLLIVRFLITRKLIHLRITALILFIRL